MMSSKLGDMQSKLGDMRSTIDACGQTLNSIKYHIGIQFWPSQVVVEAKTSGACFEGCFALVGKISNSGEHEMRAAPLSSEAQVVEPVAFLDTVPVAEPDSVANKSAEAGMETSTTESIEEAALVGKTASSRKQEMMAAPLSSEAQVVEPVVLLDAVPVAEPFSVASAEADVETSTTASTEEASTLGSEDLPSLECVSVPSLKEDELLLCKASDSETLDATKLPVDCPNKEPVVTNLIFQVGNFFGGPFIKAYSATSCCTPRGRRADDLDDKIMLYNLQEVPESLQGA